MASGCIVVAGHLCVDFIPAVHAPLLQIAQPGALGAIGEARWSLGGAVGNSGLALHRLADGVAVRLVAKIGQDRFGEIIEALLNERDSPEAGEPERLTSNLLRDPTLGTSYTIVIDPPGVDRALYSHFGTLDHTTAEDIGGSAALEGASILHFGYPTHMRQFYINDGAELAALFTQAKAAGITTSIDVALPDASLPSAALDWRSILRTVLPHTDVFAPSLAELVFMLDRPRFERECVESGIGPTALESSLTEHLDWVDRSCAELLEMGAAVVVVKLGEHGIRARSTADAARLSPGAMGAAAPERTGASLDGWLDQSVVAPAFRIRELKGSVGAGDATVGGFLASMLRGLSLAECCRMACATGAASVEGAEAADEIPTWGELRARVEAGWATLVPGEDGQPDEKL